MESTWRGVSPGDLILGIAVAAVRRPGRALVPGTAFAAKYVLQAAIVVFGGTLRLSQVAHVGGGASVLVDRLIERGLTDMTVLDVSAAALAEARRRLTAEAPVAWLCEDMLLWRPARRFDLWHDRAVFHFLVSPDDRDTGRRRDRRLRRLARSGAPDRRAGALPTRPRRAAGHATTRSVADPPRSYSRRSRG